MKRKTPLRRNKKRRERLFRRQFGSKERLEWLKRSSCLCGKPAAHAHHVKSRGAGGTADDLVPLCVSCHTEIHWVGIKTFELENGVDLKTLARLYAEGWKAHLERQNELENGP